MKTTIDVPDRIASSTETNISIALRVDDKGLIIPIAKDDLSLYAYLPMNENRYKFPFYINADFVPKSDREGLNTDNPWNHFLFYQIGINLVRMVSNIATHSQPQYLNLLLKKEMQTYINQGVFDSPEEECVYLERTTSYQQEYEQCNCFL